MHHSLAGSQIRLTYLQDWRALAGIDWPTVFDDLTDAHTPMPRWQWCDLDALTHVVLASDRNTGRYAGVLGLARQRTTRGTWLSLGIALARPDIGGGTLARAMFAHVLARVICLDGKPAAIAASPTNRAALLEMNERIRSAALHPPAAGNVIAFGAATIARQIGNDRTVLDLRDVPESALLRDLRGLHAASVKHSESKLGEGERAETTAAEFPMARAATSDAAMRRPRKATRTGKTG